MDRELLTGILILLGGVVIASLSQILLKYAAERQYDDKRSEYFNPFVIGGYALFLGVTFLNVYALRFIPLSLASALDASGQIFVPLFSWLILKERISWEKMKGMAVIIFGILLFLA